MIELEFIDEQAESKFIKAMDEEDGWQYWGIKNCSRPAENGKEEGE